MGVICAYPLFDCCQAPIDLCDDFGTFQQRFVLVALILSNLFSRTVQTEAAQAGAGDCERLKLTPEY